MNTYQKEHFDTFALVRRFLATLSGNEKDRLLSKIEGYRVFREDTARFLSDHFAHVCTQKCFHNDRSACCSREGIIAFFADLVVNILISGEDEIDLLLNVLQKTNHGYKCIYLGPHGCLWRLKPIVCEMFLCDHAWKALPADHTDLRTQWAMLKQREKGYKWPDRPVLFDDLEKIFIDAGHLSPLMYLHNSPGLLRIKRKAKQ